MAKYVCTHRVKHDGKIYAAGDAISVPKDVAAHLLARNAIEKARSKRREVEEPDDDNVDTGGDTGGDGGETGGAGEGDNGPSLPLGEGG